MPLSMVRGDSKDIPFVVLNKPVSLSGAWTWDGTLTILSDDTSGVAVGNWIRLPVLSGAKTNPLFKVTAVNPNVDVTIENPRSLTVPSGTGAEGSSAVDLTGGVVKFTMTRQLDEPNASAAAHKTSYDSAEIDLTAPAAGEGTVHLLAPDTSDEAPGVYTWDIETTRKGASITVSGQVNLTAGSGVMDFSDAADVALMKKADVILPAGVAGNDVEVTIEATQSEDSSLTATQVRTDYGLFVTESTVSFSLWRGNRKTPIIDTMTIDRDATL